MIHITEDKLKAAIQICLGGDGIYTEEREAKLVHDIKALTLQNVRESALDAFNTLNADTLLKGQRGMSKRFYAACAVIQGVLAGGGYYIGKDDAETLVKRAYELADELLKQENYE